MGFLFQYLWTPIAVFTIGYLLLRIMGKKAVAEMSSFDLLVTIILGTTITEPIVTKRLGVAAYFAVAIAVVYLLFSYLSLSNKFKRIITSSPTVLVRNGDIDERGLRKIRLNMDEFIGALRVKGYENIKDLALVTMEETGQISVIPKSEKRPLQPSDLHMSPSPAFIPIPIIIDGDLIEQNLKYIKKDMDWLTLQLQSNNLSLDSLETITLAVLNQRGILDVDTTNRTDHDEGVYNYKPGNDN